MRPDISAENCPLDRTIIQSILPHRDPILFVDEVLSYDNVRIKTRIDLSRHADLFTGHFPDRAILPGVYMIEMAAQSGALLVGLTQDLDDNNFIAFSGVDKAKFRRPIAPGELIEIDVEIVKARGILYKFMGTISVEGKVATSLEFTASQMSFESG